MHTLGPYKTQRQSLIALPATLHMRKRAKTPKKTLSLIRCAPIAASLTKSRGSTQQARFDVNRQNGAGRTTRSCNLVARWLVLRESSPSILQSVRRVGSREQGGRAEARNEELRRGNGCQHGRKRPCRRGSRGVCTSKAIEPEFSRCCTQQLDERSRGATCQGGREQIRDVLQRGILGIG